MGERIEVSGSGVSAGGDVLVQARLDRTARERLDAWIRDRLERGGDVADLRAMLRGSYDGSIDTDAVLVADATGDAEVLGSTVPELSEALATGDWDEVLGDLLEAERLGADRKGAIRDLEARIRLRDARARLDCNLDELAQRLASGALDPDIRWLQELEGEGRARKGAFALLEARQAKVDAAAVLEGSIADLEAWLATGPEAELIAHVREVEGAGKARKGAFELLDRLET